MTWAEDFSTFVLIRGWLPLSSGKLTLQQAIGNETCLDLFHSLCVLQFISNTMNFATIRTAQGVFHNIKKSSFAFSFTQQVIEFQKCTFKRYTHFVISHT